LADIYDTPTKIVNELIGLGFSYRRQDMFRDINTLLDPRRITALYPVWERDKPRPDEQYARSWDFSRPERYRVSGKLLVRDPISGEMSDRYVSYFTNRKLDVDDELSLLANAWTDKWKYTWQVDVLSFEPVMGYKNMKTGLF
jgi:hypothetical protein